MQRLRVEKMERQLANLTGLVHKALQVPGAPAAAPRQEFQPPYQARPTSQGNIFNYINRNLKMLVVFIKNILLDIFYIIFKVPNLKGRKKPSFFLSYVF